MNFFIFVLIFVAVLSAFCLGVGLVLIRLFLAYEEYESDADHYYL